MIAEKLNLKDLIENNETFIDSGFNELKEYEKEMVVDLVYLKLGGDEMVFEYEDYVNILEHNFGKDQDYSGIDFNDEIIDIEEVGEIEMYDIQVDKNHLYFANEVLTHNSSYDNLESGLDSIADSLGVIQTADNVIALLSNEQLRGENQSLVKFLKNRNTGKLSSHLVEVDFSTVRFIDLDEDRIVKNVEKINSNVLQKSSGKEIQVSVMNFD